MSRIFLAMPQYKAISLDEERELVKHFFGAKSVDSWRPFGLHPMTTKSLFLLNKDKAFSSSHYAELNIQRNDSMVERARCTIFGAWLREWRAGNKFDYFLCLDEDVEFHPTAIQSMINADKPIIGGAYTYKTSEGIKAGRPVCRYLPDEAPDENGIMKIRWLNGGFALFKAETLLRMMECYPDLRYDISPEESEEINESYGFWMPMVRRMEDGKTPFISEDYAVCQRAIDIGLDIWLDCKVDLIHWSGKTAYRIGGRPQEVDRDGIAGWMSQEELAWLSGKAKEMDSIVEIGSWKGRSTKVLLENCPGTVYAVDHFKGSSDITGLIAKNEDVYSQFYKNVGQFKNLKILRMPSEEGASQFDGEKVDMVFIDGDHTRKGVMKDINLWLPKCRKLICGHDYNEVMYTVHEVLGNVEVVDKIWFKYV